MLYGALEAGGTKMVCAVGDENGTIRESFYVPTTTPEETMPAILDFFRDREIAALGIACFGPIDVDKASPTFGRILRTPKLPWVDYDMVGTMRRALGVPVGFDTDVNGSLLGEVTWGAAKGVSDVIYITIGTGIGGGILANGEIVHGMLHPELGHMILPYAPGDPYKGRCPFHGHCLEGLASGPAIEERWGAKGSELADREEVWELESFYIAKAISNLICILSPKMIILGGGVMHQQQLFPLIRRKVLENLNGYLTTGELENIDHYIIPAGLQDNQGIMGAVRLAMDAEAEDRNKRGI